MWHNNCHGCLFLLYLLFFFICHTAIQKWLEDQVDAAASLHHLALPTYYIDCACIKWHTIHMHTNISHIESHIKHKRYNHMLFQYSIFIRRWLTGRLVWYGVVAVYAVAISRRMVRSRARTYDETNGEEKKKLHKRHRNECNCASESVTCVHMTHCRFVLRFHLNIHIYFMPSASRFCRLLELSQIITVQIDWEIYIYIHLIRCSVQSTHLKMSLLKPRQSRSIIFLLSRLVALNGSN